MGNDMVLIHSSALRFTAALIFLICVISVILFCINVCQFISRNEKTERIKMRNRFLRIRLDMVENQLRKAENYIETLKNNV